MYISLDQLSPDKIYFTMTQVVIPRPVAWVLTDNGNHTFNLAPYSYFNAICSEPPLILISAGKKPDGSYERHAGQHREAQAFRRSHRSPRTGGTHDSDFEDLAPWGIWTRLGEYQAYRIHGLFPSASGRLPHCDGLRNSMKSRKWDRCLSPSYSERSSLSIWTTVCVRRTPMAVSKSMPTAWIRSDVWAAANTSLSAGSSVSPAEVTIVGCLYVRFSA